MKNPFNIIGKEISKVKNQIEKHRKNLESTLKNTFFQIKRPQFTDETATELNGNKRLRELSLKKYSNYIIESIYITVRDGTKLAADIYKPVDKNRPVAEPLPVIWAHQRYHRRNKVFFMDFKYAFYTSPWAEDLLKYGYIIAIVNTRGGGASFGTSDTLLSDEENQDSYDITKWLSERKWCNGQVGMFGHSYVGTNQLTATTTHPPALKALSPEMPFFDAFSFIYPNGVFLSDFAKNWTAIIHNLDKVLPALGVDSDVWRKMARRARKQHQYNRDLYQQVIKNPYRDSRDEKYDRLLYFGSPCNLLKEINRNPIPSYFISGWHDIFTKQTLLAYRNWKGPKKLIIGPWRHMERFSAGTERLKWYDYWLKGKNTEIMEEYQVYYYTMGNGHQSGWKAAPEWPLPDVDQIPFYFSGQPSGTIDSVIDGSLINHCPEPREGHDNYITDYSCSSGLTTRWRFVGIYTDMQGNDQKGLTYTTMPLSMDVEIGGFPIVDLWISTYDRQTNLFVYLEEIGEDGASKYITEGVMNTSHRKTTHPPYDHFGLPFHPGNEKDIKEMEPGKIERIQFDMLPISYSFKAGNRIRITITGCDKDNYLTAKRSQPPQFSIYRNRKYPSNVTLPVVGLKNQSGLNTDFYSI